MCKFISFEFSLVDLLDIEIDQLPGLLDQPLDAAGGGEVGEDEGDGDLLPEPLLDHLLQLVEQLPVPQGERVTHQLLHLPPDQTLQEVTVGKHLET